MSKSRYFNQVKSKLLFLISIFLVLPLTACVVTFRIPKSTENIIQETFQTSVQMEWRQPNERPLKIIVFSAKSRTLLGDLVVPFDFLVPLRSSRKDSKKLRDLLLMLKKHPDYILVYITENPRFDYRVISRALRDLQLDGVKFFLVARPNKIAKFESIITASGADFMFINESEKPDKYIEWNFMKCDRKILGNPLICPEGK